MSEKQPTTEQDVQIENELRDVEDDPELSVRDQLPLKAVVLILAGTAIIITMLITGFNPLRFITQEVIIVGLFVALSSVFSAPIVIAGIKSIWTPPRIFLADIDAVKEDGLGIWAAHPSLAKDLEVREGKLRKTDVHGYRVWIGRGFRINENSIKGTWRGMADDLEILNNEQEIMANRGRLKYYARIGRELEAKFPALVNAIEGSVWASISQKVLSSTTMDPELVRNEVIREIDAMEDADQPESVERAAAKELNREVGDAVGVEFDETGGVKDE